MRIHDWVRDAIRFGIPPSFYRMKASEIVKASEGYCNTKATVFCALLRACGIASPIRVFDLSAQVLKGLFDPGSTSVDHTITEVWLGGRWVCVDSHVVDTRLEAAARRRLEETGERAGYGIHVAGSTQCDGRSDSLIQCVDAGMNGIEFPGTVRPSHQPSQPVRVIEAG